MARTLWFTTALVAVAPLAQAGPPHLSVPVPLTCPSARQLRDALARAFARTDGRGTVTLTRADGALLIVWTGEDGEELARHLLEVRSLNCDALAETAALVALAWAQGQVEVPPPTRSPSVAPNSVGRAPKAIEDAGFAEAGPVEPRTSTAVAMADAGETQAVPPVSAEPVAAVAVAPSVVPSPPATTSATASVHPIHLTVRAGAIGALGFLSPPFTALPGGGGQLALELGFGNRFGLGASASLLSNLNVAVATPAGEAFIHRQRYDLFASFAFLRSPNQWASAELGVVLGHLLTRTSGYGATPEQDDLVPGGSVQALYAHLLAGPLFAFAEGGLDLSAPVSLQINLATPRQQTLFTVSPVGLNLELGLGVRLF